MVTTSQEAFAAATVQAGAQPGHRDALAPGQVATRTEPANWFSGDHAGLSQTSGLDGRMAVRADAAREEEFLSVYSMAHADKDTKSSLGAGFVPQGIGGGAEAEEVAWLKRQFAQGGSGGSPTQRYDAAMRRLRTVATNKQIDMTDALSSYVGGGREANTGLMPKGRFSSALGDLFGGELERGMLDSICARFAAGDVDHSEAGGFTKVKFKAFALAFDATPPPSGGRSDFEEVMAEPRLMHALSKLRSSAVRRRLDLTDALEEYAGSGREANLGLMAKNRFRAAMGTLFQGERLGDWLLSRICAVYGAGDADRAEPGSRQKVLWRAFAFDFDEKVAPLPAAPKPDPSAAIVDAMWRMNAHANQLAIDLEADLEDLLGRATDVAPRARFCTALSIALSTAASPFQLSETLLDDICSAYAAGKKHRPHPTRPNHFESVQWREFAADVARLQPQPFLEARGHR